MENQNTVQDDGLTLLKKVIETNERNIEKTTELINEHINSTNFLNQVLPLIKHSATVLENSVNNIPKSIELILSEPTKRALENNTAQHKKKNFREYFTMVTLFIAVLIILFTSKLAFQWYSESIRTKSEIRQEILDEIKNSGQATYKVEDYKQLEYNTDLMNKWIKKNPKDAEKFLRFKEGYESR